jgi:hypothetical protein
MGEKRRLFVLLLVVVVVVFAVYGDSISDGVWIELRVE